MHNYTMISTTKGSKHIKEIRTLFNDIYPQKNFDREHPYQNTDQFVIYRKDDKIVGYCQVSYKMPEPNFQHKGYYIYNLAVLNSYQKQGIATELIKYVKKLFRNTKIFIHINYKYGHSRLLMRCGFKFVHHYKKYFDTWMFTPGDNDMTDQEIDDIISKSDNNISDLEKQIKRKNVLRSLCSDESITKCGYYDAYENLIYI